MNKIIQDMIPTRNKAPLKDAIPVERAGKRQPMRKIEPAEVSERKLEHELDLEPMHRQKKPRRPVSTGILGTRTVRPWLFALIALICLCALVYAFSLVYARATVTITPATIVIPVSGTYTAYANSAASGTLAYKIIQTNGQQSQTVAATTGSLTTAYAKGTVILYNNFSSASQKLVAGTRLSSGNGLIYTLNNAVIVPGISKGSAGSIAVAVTAAGGGPSYNISTSDLLSNPSYGDFNIVAYKGTSKYAGFYARLNPNGAGITGGFSGHQIIVASSTVAAANQIMEQSLQSSLLSQAKALIPADYVLLDNAYGINYAMVPASTTSTTSATVGVVADFYGILFKKTDLAEAIAPTQYNSSFDPQSVDSTEFTVDNPETFSPTNGQPLNFTLKGTLDLVGIISTSTLESQLAGVSLAQSVDIFKGYSTIATAHATILPFWKRSFPSSPSRISILIQNQ